MENNKLIGVFIIFLMCFTFIAAESDFKAHTLNQDLYFSFSDTIAQGCNMTTLDVPNNNTININAPMTLTGSATFNGFIGESNFSSLGVYCINIECVDGFGSVCREVTKTGTKLTQEEDEEETTEEEAPETARTAGKSIQEFKQGLKEVPKALEEVKEDLKK